PEACPLVGGPDGRVEEAEARCRAVEHEVTGLQHAHEAVTAADELRRLRMRQRDETDAERGRRAWARGERLPHPLPPLGAPPERVEAERRCEVLDPARRDGGLVA